MISTELSVGISAVALSVSAITAWLTFFRTGVLQMTQPTIIFFGRDGGSREGEKPGLKVFLRTLLFSTSRRGQILESLHLNLQRGESSQNFSIWVYGDKPLARGSGLHIGFEGISCNHHFLLPKVRSDFRFLAGDYNLRVFGKRITDRIPRQLCHIRLHLSEGEAKELIDEEAGIYFDWSPDEQQYQSHVDLRVPKMPGPGIFF
jgi:hypothetical protein